MFRWSACATKTAWWQLTCACASASVKLAAGGSMGEELSDVFAVRRLAMVVKQLRERGINDERVLKAMAEVPRHEFVGIGRQAHAYEDEPVEIVGALSISQT